MGCDSQFDYLYDTPELREKSLKAENARLKAELATIKTRMEGKDPDSRGYDEVRGFLVCRFDRTVTDSMDVHNMICTRPKNTVISDQ